MKLLAPTLILCGVSSLSLAASNDVPLNTIQWANNPASARSISPGSLSVAANEPSAKSMQGAAAQSVSLSARLVNPDKEAKNRAASVLTQVDGLEIVDAHQVNEQPRPGQGHLHYQLDNGPIIATTAPKLDFHELSPGQHQISVMLVGNDHQPLGPKQTLNVTIPAGE